MSTPDEQIYVVEIPHRLNAIIFETTRPKIIAWADDKTDETIEWTFDSAMEFLGNDMHTFIYFDTFAELKEWCRRYAANNGHQALRLLSQLEAIELR